MSTNESWLNTDQCRQLSLLEAAIVQNQPDIQHLPLALVVGENQQICWTHYLTANHVYFKTMQAHELQVSEQDLIVETSHYDCPFLPKSLNLAILPHTLNYCLNPGLFLANLTPCLRDDGYLVLFLFERCSLLPWRQKLIKKNHSLVCPYFHSTLWIKSHLKKWNYLLLRECKYFFNLPNTSSNPMLKWLSWMGEVRMLLVKRQETCVTPLKDNWQQAKLYKKTAAVKNNQHFKD